MKNFKKGISGVLAFVFAFLLLVTAVPGMNVQAATTKKITLYVGEQIYWSDYRNVKSCSASKKNIVSAKRDSDNKTHLNITAKKAGTTTLTVKTAAQTVKLAITVVKLDCTVKAVKELENGYVLFKITNNSKLFYDYAALQYTLKNAEGEVIQQDTKSAYDLMPGKASYVKVSYDNYNNTADIAQCAGKIIADGTYRNINTTYKSRISSLKIKDTVADGKLSLKLTNGYSGSISGTVDVMFYNEQGNLIEVRPVSIFLKGKATDTQTISLTYVEYASYKFNVHVYSKTY